MKTIYCLMILLWPLVSPAQTVKALNVGDEVPDITISNIYNYPASSVELPQLKGKLVILDFWATWCGSCIREFPKMQQLQQQYKGKMQIFMVDADTSESDSHVSTFLTRRKERTGESFTLPYALHNDVGLYFPLKEIPHYVWINRFGKLAGITNAEDVSAANIEKFLSDSSFTLVTKKDYLRFNPEKPLLIDENGGDDPTGFLYRSVITGFKENLGAAIGMKGNADGDITRMFALNCNLPTLLAIAYPSVFSSIGTDRIIIESKKYNKKDFTDHSLGLLPENRFCYELITPAVSRAEAYRYMQQDLYRNFRLSATNDVRAMDCYILQATKTAVRLKTGGGKPFIDVQPNTLNKFIRNESSSQLVSQVLQPLFSVPVIDESHLSYKIDLSFPFEFSNYNTEQITRFLAAKGLQLVKTNRKIKAVIISDRPIKTITNNKL